MFNKKAHNARLRGWQRMPLNSNTTTVTTAIHWDWKRYALTVPLEAFVMCVPIAAQYRVLEGSNDASKTRPILKHQLLPHQ